MDFFISWSGSHSHTISPTHDYIIAHLTVTDNNYLSINPHYLIETMWVESIT